MSDAQLRKPFLFAHSNGFPGGAYKTFLAPFQARFDVDAMPLLGHDPRFPVNLHWAALVDELEAWLATRPKPFIGAGHSMGSILMFKVALRHPDWFEALVMMDPPMINGWHAWLFDISRVLGFVDKVTPAGQSKGRRDHWPSREEAAASFRRKTFFRSLDPRCLDDYIESGLVEQADGCHLRYTVATEVGVFRNGPTDMKPTPKLAVPGLMIQGESTDALFKAAVKRHVKWHSMTWLTAKGGHMFPLQYPDESAALVLKELDTLLNKGTA